MWHFKPTQRYQQVADEEKEVSDASDSPSRRCTTRRTCQMLASILLAVLLLLAVAISSFTIQVYSHLQPESAMDAHDGQDGNTTEQLNGNVANQSSSCPRRKEWRTLSSQEQQDYISAVVCLRDQPSTLSFSKNGTSYDDFPWIHSHVGYFTHNSAPFLPWHRYFLHIYESTLREKCGYTGSLVYWDWTLDSGALENSPVFSVDSGFGGDGQADGEITVGRSGRCVVNGPFKNVTADFYDVKFQPHCLSRGFRDKSGNLGHIDGEDISASSIKEVLALEKYADFVALMESRVHDAIPFGIGGDFETFTAPYDPIFFLHHTQLDRLWFLWQHSGEDGVDKMNEYGGHSHRHSIEMASLDDKIEMKDLAPSITVAEVMNTEGELLCYTY